MDLKKKRLWGIIKIAVSCKFRLRQRFGGIVSGTEIGASSWVRRRSVGRRFVLFFGRLVKMMRAPFIRGLSVTVDAAVRFLFERCHVAARGSKLKKTLLFAASCSKLQLLLQPNIINHQFWVSLRARELSSVISSHLPIISSFIPICSLKHP